METIHSHDSTVLKVRDCSFRSQILWSETLLHGVQTLMRHVLSFPLLTRQFKSDYNSELHLLYTITFWKNSDLVLPLSFVVCSVRWNLLMVLEFTNCKLMYQCSQYTRSVLLNHFVCLILISKKDKHICVIIVISVLLEQAKENAYKIDQEWINITNEKLKLLKFLLQNIISKRYTVFFWLRWHLVFLIHRYRDMNS